MSKIAKFYGLTYDGTAKSIRALLAKLGKSPDSMAVALFAEGVRKAKCGDPNRCALAQYFANFTRKKVSVSAEIAVQDGPEVPLGSRVAFVDAFDAHAYKFLESCPK